MNKTSIILFACLAVCLFSCNGKEASKPSQSDRLFPVKLGGKWGYINRTGSITIEPRFDNAYDFYEDRACVRINGKYAFIDEKGNIIRNRQFKSAALRFSEGLARITENGKNGFIDKSGNTVIEPKYDFAFYFSEGIACVKVGDKWSYIDKTGKMVIEAKFDKARQFSEGLAAVSVKGKWGYIDKSGKTEIALQFEYPEVWERTFRFSEGLAATWFDGKWGYINKKGETVIKPGFDGASDFSEGLACVSVGAVYDKEKKDFVKPGKWGFINKKGEMVIKPQFSGGGRFSEGLAAVTTFEWEMVFIDRKGNIAFPVEFQHVATLIRPAGFLGGLAGGFTDGKWGYIDKTGKYIWKPTK
jgi:hypothetical protein